MQNHNKKNAFFISAAALLVLGMIQMSWAFWNQELLTVNEFQLGKYSTGIIEEFDSPSDWLPGIETNKDVSVYNDGTVPVFVRAVINQEWVRREEIYDSAGKIIPPAKGEQFPLYFEAANGEEYAALVNWGEDVVLLLDGVNKTTSLSLGLETVSTVEEAKGKWLLMNETPNEEGNLIFYYIGLLEADETTPLLIDSVRMNPNIQATILSEESIWDKEAETWITTQTMNASYGYENAHYELEVLATTVQATKDAVTEMYSTSKVSEQSIISYLQKIGVNAQTIDESRDDTVTEKLLYFEEVNGLMRYTPVTGTENWFMSHLNMIPGGSYQDTLMIENRSAKGYQLYMQVVPRDQSELKDELLKLIAMKVYYNDTLIYEGTALGDDYGDGKLQDVVTLGSYEAGKSGEIRVELVLDKDTPMEYAGLLTNVDWKFMVNDIPEEPSAPGTPSTPTAPVTTSVKTSDSSALMRYLIIMGAAGLISIGCISYVLVNRRREKRRD